MTTHHGDCTIAAFSGGKDSTAMVLKMHADGERFELLFTPAGNEPPEVVQHILAIAERVDAKLVIPLHPSLMDLILTYKALPNHRQRWCTRQIKIEPCIAYLTKHPGSTLCVGLRADEETREGIYGDYATYRYPLREAAWGVEEVRRFLDEQCVTVPQRTDCMWCYAQRLAEWYRLWRDRPEVFREGERIEKVTGHTFRSPTRDRWPASMEGLRLRFEAGEFPRGADDDWTLWEDADQYGACRVCSL